tara:strand:+ start:9408 stop:10400 length:993 start_codon:yes stop_codon:yes gene_type:complete
MKNILLILLFCQQLYAQNTIKNLVFEGAGVRGIAYAGAIKELENNKLISQIEKVGGTSAGAITAMMLALGYSSDEIGEIISQTKLNKFNNGKYLFFGGIYRMKKQFGWYKAKRFDKWLTTIIENKTANPNITFSELSQQGYIDLYVTATCLNKQKSLLLSKETYPAMKIKDAVRISMSIPLYFEAVFIDNLVNVYEKPKENQELDIMVDGGIVLNYPITIFDSISEGKRIINPNTLGFKIERAEQIQYDNKHQVLAPMAIHQLDDYVSALYNYVIENLNNKGLKQEDWNRTVFISSEGISPKIKKLKKEEKQKLIDSGRHHSQNYLNSFH